MPPWSKSAKSEATEEFSLGESALDGPAAGAFESDMRTSAYGIAHSNEDTMLCESLVKDLDRWWTHRADGSPTTLFKAGVASDILLGLAIPFGTWCTPGIAEAYEAQDPMLMLANIAGAVLLGIMLPLVLIDTRRLIRSDADGPLIKLGAGSRHIQESLYKSVEKSYKVFHPAYDKPKGMGVVAGTLGPFSIVLLLGVGFFGYSSAWNRVTALLFCAHFVLGGPPCLAWQLTTDTAIALLTHKIRSVIDAMAQIQEEQNTAAQRQTVTKSDLWTERVVMPCGELIEDLEIFSAEWSGGIVIFTTMAAIVDVAGVCFLLSPYVETLDQRTGITWLVSVVQVVMSFFILVGAMFPILVARGPASVSSACIDLKESLNKMRVLDLHISEDSDKQIAIIERALNNVNRGQGVGFKVMGSVIDKHALSGIAAKIFALASAATPAFLKWVHDAAMARKALDMSESACTLSEDQLNLLQTCAQMAIDKDLQTTCAFNVTLDSLLAGGEGGG